jgi:hypothetical protein
MLETGLKVPSIYKSRREELSQFDKPDQDLA